MINGRFAALGFNRRLPDYPTLNFASETQQARKAELLTLGHIIQAQPFPSWVPDSSGIVDNYSEGARVFHTTIKQGPAVGVSSHRHPPTLFIL